MITKTAVTYQISSLLIDYSGSDAGDRNLTELCDLTLEVNSEGEPIRLVLRAEQVLNFIGALSGHTLRQIVILQYP